MPAFLSFLSYMIESEEKAMAGVLIDYNKLSSFLADFYTITQIRISYWSPDGKKRVTCSREDNSAFCSRIQSIPSLKDNCIACDQKALTQAQKSRTGHVFRCHAGLEEYIYPVVQDDVLLGFFMIGQVQLTQKNLLSEKREMFEQYGLDFDNMSMLYSKLPLITPDKMKAASHMLKAIAGYLYYNGLVKYLDIPLVKKAEEYIRANIQDRITIDDICRYLAVSRSKLCHTIRAEKNLSVVQLINKIRVSIVQKELTKGAPVKTASYTAGFSSVTYCTRVFKQYVGMTPEQYASRWKTSDES